MQRLRKTLRPASSVRASAISCRPARTKAAVTGGADFRLVSQLAKPRAQVGPMTATRRRFISKRESEDCSYLKVGLVPGARDLAERGQRCPTGAMSNGDIRTGKKFAGLGLGPLRESDFVNKLCAEKQVRVDFIAQA